MKIKDFNKVNNAMVTDYFITNYAGTKKIDSFTTDEYEKDKDDFYWRIVKKLKKYENCEIYAICPVDAECIRVSAYTKD